MFQLTGWNIGGNTQRTRNTCLNVQKEAGKIAISFAIFNHDSSSVISFLCNVM